MLAQHHIDQFKSEGYTIVEHFFDDAEVALMQQELNQLVADGKLRNVSTHGDGQTPDNAQVNLQICPLSPESENFHKLPFAETIRTAVKQLIGEDFFLLLDQIFLKPGGHGAGTNWHQDNSYFQIDDPSMGTGMWIALHDANITNGTMHIVPGSDKTAREHVRDMGSDHHITCAVDDKTETIIPVEIEAGGALFFNFGIAHCTLANTTDKDRAGLALHFLRSECAKSDNQAFNKPYLSGPRYSRGESEYGENMEGAWEATAAAI